MIFSEFSFEKLFLDKFSESSKRNGLEITPELERYISSLFLEDLLKNKIPEPNLILSQLATGKCQDSEVFSEIKNTADYLTIHLGYFPESLASKKYYSLDHYFELGRKSYYNLSRMNSRQIVFEEMFQNYDSVIFSVNETADLLSSYTSREILITHQCWEKTRHQIFKKKLMRMGLIITSIED
jgi:hypothetical protein